MMEEEHRHEERLHRQKERELEREKKTEDRRRKQWEEYEKCIERRAEEESYDLSCEEPDFHHKPRKHRHHHKERAYSVEPEIDDDEDIDLYQMEIDEEWALDYDFVAPFNQVDEDEFVNEVENDLFAEPIKKKKQPVKKPIEETNRTPSSPWMNLATIDEYENDENDINFDVDKNFKFRMPTGENYQGRDVKFNVQLP